MRAAAISIPAVLLLTTAAYAQTSAKDSADGDGDQAGETARREEVPATERAFRWNLRVIGELVINSFGGIHSGGTADGLIMAGITLDTGPLGLWKGGRLRVAALGLASGNPSVNFIGDVQDVSNVEGPSEIRFARLYYRQRLASLWLRAGIMDLGDSFAVTKAASRLLNASFGTPGALADNVPTSTYPYPGFGLSGGGRFGALTTRAGIFQGNPIEIGSLFSDGYMVISELRFAWGKRKHARGDCLIGGWYHQGPADIGPPNTGGYYAVVEQALPRPGGGQAAMFAQFAGSPAAATRISYYAGFGVEVSQPLPHRHHDRFAVGVATAWLRRAEAPEVSLEATYRMRLTKQLHLQPDLQVVNSPAGSYGTALVAILRVALSLD